MNVVELVPAVRKRMRELSRLFPLGKIVQIEGRWLPSIAPRPVDLLRERAADMKAFPEFYIPDIQDEQDLRNNDNLNRYYQRRIEHERRLAEERAARDRDDSGKA